MARNKKKGGKTKKILFAVEIIVLLVFLAGFAVYGQLMSRMDKTNTQKLDTNKVQVNQEVQDSIDSETSSLSGYTTYSLFGIDARSKNMKFSGNENSDTMIIVSVNNDTKEVRMVSVYRDTLLNVGDDTYTKANAAYALGGPEQAITMLNKNLDLDISDYATKLTDRKTAEATSPKSTARATVVPAFFPKESVSFLFRTGGTLSGTVPVSSWN